ncbi:MAG: FdhF/YdeP family oxidoreductase [Deltaproteobacteria bacterium]|nr:FdhF/YdeP family oxidoreductase [Deltaproteobacteria bacterium]
MASDPHDDESPLDVREPPRAAGGFGALWATAKHLQRDGAVRRGTRALLAMNQPDGFDCPGCAWPEPSHERRSRFEFCENGAKAMAEETTTVRCTPELLEQATVEELRQLSDFELGRLGRLTHPVVLEGDDRRYRAITWDRAIALLADELRRAGPARSVFYTSGRTSNEAAFLYQLVGRMFGTNNFPDCSNMCHDSSGVALSEVVGVNKGSVSLSDFDHADLILVVGQNPGTNHPRMLATLREAAKRGATIVAINPLREVGFTRFAHPQKPLDLLGGVALAKHYIQIPIGGDQAFFLGVSKALLEREGGSGSGDRAAADKPTAVEPISPVLDRMFLGELTDGFVAWRAHVEAMPWSTILARSGVSEEQIRLVADLYASAKATIACWAMGLTQHKHAVATIQEIVNLMLLRGNVGRRGAGLCPVRGHSNVQGDRTMGIYHLPRPAFLDALGAAFGFEPPRAPGYDTVGAVRALERGDVDVFCALGGNFLSATPDTDRVARGLERCALTVSVSTKLNRTHLHAGARALILPCLGRSELDVQASGRQFVTVEDSMSMVHRSQGVLPPASPDLRSEVAIVAALGQALHGARVPWAELAGDYGRVRDVISLVVPGFDDFNERVAAPDGFQLPNVARDRSFASIGGRAKFTISTPPDLTLPPGHLRMMTIRTHDQYNTTIYGLDDRYRGIRGERRVVLVNAADLAELGLAERQVVDLVSIWPPDGRDGEERVAEAFIVLPYDLPRGNAATYFPEANPLVPLDSVADRSNTPTSKSVVIRIRPR